MVQGGNGRLLSGINFAALVMDGVEAKELFQPWHALEEAGAILRVISARNGQVQAFEEGQPKEQVDVHLSFEEADAQEFVGVLIPGGARHAAQLRNHPEARQFMQGMASDGKPIAAIDHGIALLVDAGLVQGRSLTGPAELKNDVVQAGGNWVNQDVASDGLLVSGRDLESLPAFIEAALTLMENRVKESVQGTRDENADIGPSS